jgi:hypothetical protein
VCVLWWKRVLGFLHQGFCIERISLRSSRCLDAESVATIEFNAIVSDSNIADVSNDLDAAKIAIVRASHVQNRRDSHSYPNFFRSQPDFLFGGCGE